MIKCQVCDEKVNNSLLRTDSPKCKNGHQLGTWSYCNNQNERHVYLALDHSVCPYCKSPIDGKLLEGSMVKCLNTTTTGVTCTTRPFVWMKEGPPCFMNHVSKMKLE